MSAQVYWKVLSTLLATSESTPRLSRRQSYRKEGYTAGHNVMGASGCGGYV